MSTATANRTNRAKNPFCPSGFEMITTKAEPTIEMPSISPLTVATAYTPSFLNWSLPISHSMEATITVAPAIKNPSKKTTVVIMPSEK